MKINLIILICLVIIMLVAISPSFAKDDESDSAESSEKIDPEKKSSSKEYILPEEIVTGKRTSEDKFTSDRSVSIVNEKALTESAPRTTPEVLWDAPGAFVQQTNYGGGSPIVRGLVGPQILMMVDGVRLNNSTYRTGPLQYLNMIDPDSISRIEVMRGPGSVLYGSDAMGGVIQVFTVSPRDLSDPDRFGGGGTLSGRYSSADSGGAGHVHADVGYGPFGVLGGGTYRSSDDLIGGREVGEQVFTGYDNWAAIGKVALNFDYFGLIVGYLFNETEDAGRTDKFFDKGALSLYDNRDNLGYVKLRGTIDPIYTEAILTASYQDFFERKDAINFEDDLETELDSKRDDLKAVTWGADLQIATRVLKDRLRFLYGGMYYHDLVSANREKKETPLSTWQEVDDKAYPDGSTYSNYGAYMLIEGDPVSTKSGHIFRMGAGYRWHGMRGIAPEDKEKDFKEVDFDYTGNVFQGTLQYLYKTQANIAFTFSQGFRAPNLQEAVMLGDTGSYFHVPNYDLKPEASDTAELLVRGRFWKMELGAAGYVSFLHDLIVREDTIYEGETEINEKPVTYNVNGGEGMVWGLEPQLFFDIGYGFSLAGHMTYTWGEVEDSEGKMDSLTRIPPLFGRLGVRYDTVEFTHWKGHIELFSRAAAKQDRLSTKDEEDARIPKDGTPGWLTFNIRSGVTVHDIITLGMIVENITNEKYKYHGSGIWGPGTNAILTAKIKY